MSLSLPVSVLFICILSIQLGQITSADDRYRSRRQRDRKTGTGVEAGGDETRNGLQGGVTFRLDRRRARVGLRLHEEENIKEDSDVLSPARGKTRKDDRKEIRKTAKKKGTTKSQGQLKQQILSRLVGTDPVPVAKVSN